MNDYRYPFITGKDPAEKISQIESYLRQLVDKMNTESSGSDSVLVQYNAATGGKVPVEKEKTISEKTFNEIKSLIIKSADFVDSFYEQYNKKLSGYYVAKSEFGTYTEDVALQLSAAADRLSSTITSIENITSENKKFQDMTNARASQIEQTAGEITLNVEAILSDGVKQVKTDKGYVFNEEGLTISESGSQISNFINNQGMYVKRGDDALLVADINGVAATDVTVNNYLIVGNHARFENYPTNRTACFYLEKED